jgi:hypothetical protein
MGMLCGKHEFLVAISTMTFVASDSYKVILLWTLPHHQERNFHVDEKDLK